MNKQLLTRNIYFLYVRGFLLLFFPFKQRNAKHKQAIDPNVASCLQVQYFTE